MHMVTERRRQRSNDVFRALAYQLRACREDANLDALVLSDQDGLCIAAAGPADACDEVAATLPILGRKAGDFSGVLLGAGLGSPARLQRFSVHGLDFYLCALGGNDELRNRQIARSISGISRILAAV
jgi:hypothetical protein